MPLSENFDSAALTPAGPVAVGYTENDSNGLGELLGVQTDTTGAVGTCSQIHAGPLSASATGPGLTNVAPGLTTPTTAATQSPSPAQTQVTSVTATSSQC